MPYPPNLKMEEIDYSACDGWYDNDLQLAAELGKTLLERNKELEALLISSQQQNQEQSLQIVYLEKQLQVLRDVTETKAKIYEELDMSSQELEKTNDSLNHELRTAEQKMASMSEQIEQLEHKVVDQQQQMEHLRKAERGRLIEGRKQKRILESLLNFSPGGFQLRRAHSFDLGKSSIETAFEEELTTLQMNVRNLRTVVTNKEKRQGELEMEIAVLLKEKQQLERKMRELSVKAKVNDINRDSLSLDDKNFQVCRFCDRAIHADEEDEGPVPKLLSSSGEPEDKEISILSEIDSQYKALMEKYNTLLEHSRTPDGYHSRSGSLRRKKDTAAQAPEKQVTEKLSPPMDLPQLKGKVSPVSSHFENSPPEYKKLFQEIFDILGRVKQPYIFSEHKQNDYEEK